MCAYRPVQKRFENEPETWARYNEIYQEVSPLSQVPLDINKKVAQGTQLTPEEKALYEKKKEEQFELEKKESSVERIRAQLVILYDGKHDDLLEDYDRQRSTEKFYIKTPDGLTEEEKAEWLRKWFLEVFTELKAEDNEKDRI
jgi:hypothetical protein